MAARSLASSITSEKLSCTSDELTVVSSSTPDTRKNTTESRIGTKPIRTYDSTSLRRTRHRKRCCRRFSIRTSR